MARLRPADRHRHDVNRGKAVPLELFFDLVFVFAITQVTSLLAADPTWSGLGRGLAVLAVLWWAWVGYSWLASATDPEEGWVRLAFFAAMAAMFVVSLAVVDPFGDAAVVFALAYLLVRVLHLVVFLVLAAGDATFRRAVLSMAPSFVIAPSLLVMAAFTSGLPRGVLWALALVVDFGGALLGGSRGWRLNPAHFAERHGLIVIIALGEAIVAVGVAADGAAGVTSRLVVTAVTVIAVAGAFWWAYFDVVAIAAERKLHELTGISRNRLARDSYSYLHLFLVAGIVLVALGAKKTAAAPSATLDLVPAVALGGGAAMYLLALSALRWRNYGSPNVYRLVAAPVVAAMAIPLADRVSGLASLLSVAVLVWTLLAVEVVALAETRHRLRHPDEEPTA